MNKEIENTIPVMPVKELSESISFYRDKLGFCLDDWGDPDPHIICSVSRDNCSIMLQKQPANVTPSCVWIGLDSEQLIDECRANDVEIIEEASNQPWAYSMKIKDIDGNIIWLGTEPRK